MLNKKDMGFIFKYWFFSRVLIGLITFITISFFSFQPTYPYWQNDLEPLGPRFLWTWGAFDGAHYVRLARNGYDSAFTQAFFPLYPLLIRSLGVFTSNYLVIGLLISNLSFLTFLIILYKLLLSSFTKKIVKKTIKIYLFFPTSFFFHSLYTESFFMLLVVLSFYLLNKNKWLLSSFFAALASATRLVGISLSLAIFVKWIQEKKAKDKKLLLKGGFYSLLSSFGLLSYMLFLKKQFTDPFVFLKAMSLWEKNKPVFFLQTFFRYIKMLSDFTLTLERYYVVFFEFIIGVLFFYLLIVSFKKVDWSYFVYNLFSFLLPLSSGTFSSLPRYVLVLFPSFVMLARILAKKKKVNLLYWIFNFLFLMISVNLFIRGRFLA